jgi:hypothetical protein
VTQLVVAVAEHLFRLRIGKGDAAGAVDEHKGVRKVVQRGAKQGPVGLRGLEVAPVPLQDQRQDHQGQ